MPAKKADAAAYDPETVYVVTLSRVVDGPNGPLLPPNRNMLKGKFIVALGDAVTDAQPV
jgi:hypothetical protein